MLAFIESQVTAAAYEYAVLVTSTDYEILTVAQLSGCIDASCRLPPFAQIDCGAVDGHRAPHAHLATGVCAILPEADRAACSKMVR